MNTRRKSTRFAVLGLLLLATIGSLVGVSAAASPITIAQLAGPWQIAVSGNNGCGVSSIAPATQPALWSAAAPDAALALRPKLSTSFR
jgi:hypothetical protein